MELVLVDAASVLACVDGFLVVLGWGLQTDQQGWVVQDQLCIACCNQQAQTPWANKLLLTFDSSFPPNNFLCH